MDSLMRTTGETTEELRRSNLNGEYSGRDSGMSNESECNQTYQETNAKLLEVEMQLQEKFMSSHKELQEAKQKLEELRLLRFEEKSVLKQEIKQLHEKYGEEERNSTKLERQLKKYSADKIVLDERISDLEREQSIGAQINMTQEQEIIRLEMKLKNEEIQRHEVSRQLDLLRKTILEKDQQRMKQQSEVFMLKEKVTQLEESCTYYKTTADEGQQKIWEIEKVNHNLNEEISSLKIQFGDARSEVERVCLDLRHAQMKVAQMEETTDSVQKDLSDYQINLESQLTKCKALEEEVEEDRKQQVLLQKDLENATFNENKYKEKYEHTERSFHQTRREKDQEIYELQRIVDGIPGLEEQIGNLEERVCEREFLLNELRDAVSRHIRKQDDGIESDDAELSHLSPSRSSGKSLFTVKGKVTDHVTPGEIEEYFKEADINMRSLQEQIMTLSQQVEREQSMMADLSTTIGSLRSELGRAQSNLTNNVQIKETVEEQYQQANETIQFQEKNIEKKNKEMEFLRETIDDYKRQVDVLKTQVASLNSEIVKNTCAHKEETLRLQIIVDGVEREIDNERDETKDAKKKFQEEANTFKDFIETQNNEIRDLKSEMENLIEDNKNLAQRLMHLETYSDKLSDMLDKNQTADDKAREKFTNEIKEYKIILTEKDAEVNELSRKVDELSESVREKSEYQEQIDKKMKCLAASLQNLEDESKQTLKEKEVLETKLKSVSDAHLTAERTLLGNTEENQSLDKRCSEQLKLMEELHERINFVEGENASLKQSVSTMERCIRLKEGLIAELSRKAGETTESFSNLKSSHQKAETDKRHYENQLNIFRHEKQILDKSIREHEDEKSYLRDQVVNLQRLLARAEDDKEMSLGNMVHHQSQVEALRSIKEKTALKDLEGQIQSLRVELNLERQRRERLETRYTTRDDQVNQLRSTFDQSLNTISKDTKNIKSIIGRSLQKIDRIENNEVTDSDFVDTDSESFEVNAKVNINSRYLTPSSHRSKSLESSLDGIKVGTTHTSSSSTPRKGKHSDTKPSPTSTTKTITTLSSPRKALSFLQETPVRDEATNNRKSKR